MVKLEELKLYIILLRYVILHAKVKIILEKHYSVEIMLENEFEKQAKFRYFSQNF